ncbi:MAG TPA: hypothetical protein VHX88_16175 [Solirubrobacteraceae bacterium]|jgi:hypothetical protein|nr:hypothetical protein [Solirubrobacteraceae bacterium]
MSVAGPRSAGGDELSEVHLTGTPGGNAALLWQLAAEDDLATLISTRCPTQVMRNATPGICRAPGYGF